MPSLFSKGFRSGSARLKAPTADGTAGQALITDGAGQLSFTTVSSGDNVSSLSKSIGWTADNTYDIGAAATRPRVVYSRGLNVQLVDAANTGLLIQNAASQTGPAIQVQNSAGSAFCTFTADGRFILNNTNPLISTTQTVQSLPADQYIAQFVGTNTSFCGFNVSSTGTGKPFIQLGKGVAGGADFTIVEEDASTLVIRDGAAGGAIRFTFKDTGDFSATGTAITFANLPITNPGVAGRLWNDAGTVKIA